MTHFRDHADATFAGHALFEQPCQSWMVRRVLVPETGEPLPPASTDIVTSSAYHFVITWLPGRALVITGDIGEAVYSGITHLASLEETVRLVRETSFDYLSGKSTHKKEYDGRRTVEHIVERAYEQMRQSFDADDPSYRERSLVGRIVDWHSGNAFTAASVDNTSRDRKDACRALLEDDELSQEDAIDIANDWEIGSYSWPAAAHWHYEALRTWANLMARARGEAKLAEARAAATAGEAA